MKLCAFDDAGYPTSNPPGGFPPGFHLVMEDSGMPRPVAGPEYPMPPRVWDGRMETAGFTWPQPGTPHYNMLLCSPIPVMSI